MVSNRRQIRNQSEPRQDPGSLISVVLPVYNEAEVLRHLHDVITKSVSSSDTQLEIIYVNDGSTDASATICDQIADLDSRVIVLHFSRNFGHQAAVQAGLSRATGDAVIVMDSDLQDDPACLPDMIEAWRQGSDVVYAVRAKRKENLLKRILFASFYRMLNAVSQQKIPMDAGNFGLVDRQVVNNILELKERDRFYPGLRHWVGFRQTGVVVERAARYDNQPRVSLLGLFRLAKTALFSFSSAPLAIFYCFSLISLLVCVLFTSFTLYHKMISGLATPGWTSTIIIASFFGALNALGIGILGEYVFRIYEEVRQRPCYIVSRETGHKKDQNESAVEQNIRNDIEELNQVIGQCCQSVTEHSEAVDTSQQPPNCHHG